MSCATFNQQPVKSVVSAGSLPEGYCPPSIQQMLNDFASRLIVTPSTQFSSFVAGSQEPSGNQGPWLKNCEEWWFFNDATGRYEPQPKSGFNSISVFTSNGTFTVPDQITKIMVQSWGGGGGGGDDGAGNPGNGGGGGAYGLSILTVAPSQSIPIVVGTGGAGGSPGSNGGATTVLTTTAGGGVGGSAGPAVTPGTGGVATGFDVNMPGQSGARQVSSSPGWGGDAGGGGGGGGAQANIAAQNNGVFPGGAGSGDYVGGVGPGNGANGLVIIFY
jgi:glycine rich protein